MRAARGFKFDEFDDLCGELDGEQLQLKWQHYTRALSAASTSTAVATLAAGPTGGVSMIGAMIAGPLIHNARKKRQIIEHHMSIRGIEPETRNKDIYGPMGFSAIVSHAAIDAGVTAAEDKHSQREHDKEIEKAGAQLVRANTAPVSQVVPMNPSIGQVLLNHTKSMPTSLGATANGLIASAARLKAEKYPLLKEYLTSVAVQSRGTLSKQTSREGGPRAPFRSGTSQNYESHSSSAPLSSIQEKAFVPDTSPSPATSREPVELDSTPRTAPSKLDSCIVSPLSPPSSASHWPSPPQSFVSELEDASSPGSSTFHTSTGSSELPGDADTIMSSLLEAIDETTLNELEADLECAVVEMDNPETWINSVEKEAGAAASTPEARRMSRTFKLPSDLDSLVRRHSTRFTRRSSQRGSSVRYSQYSFVEGEDKLSTASITTLRKPASQATLRTSASSTRLQVSSLDGDQRLVQQHDNLKAKSLETHTHPNRQLRRPASNSSLLPAYSAVDAASAPAYKITHNTNEPHSPQDHDLHARQQQGESSRGAPAGHDTAAHDATDGIHNPPLSSSRSLPLRPMTHHSSSGSMSSALSRTGSVALSAHEGMKKVGYFGLEPATKLAIAGSLLMVGVRPSVQRKYLDKAKGRMGLPVEDKGNNGFMGMGKEFGKGEEKQKRVHGDDAYLDYI
ncbi:hypothetical protein INS49_013183 [Diaporthe citri]|uniref:uncharacterized protein n=1 Tax=Diaporthe citri TaxID=83186 RepID=UPI001C7E927F|nr:uncharacterized protein INS49_013183 [Diaporthe citri]KAG6359660.1 hypothetical protein INS49_013183 [Diaporthe citri]